MNVIVAGAVFAGIGALLLFAAPEILAMMGPLKFSVMPIDGMTPSMVTQRFKAEAPNKHNGIDIAAKIGTPLVCVAPGVVVTARDTPTANDGRVVIVKGRLPYTPTIGWGYAHLSRIDVVVGQELNAGDVIGLCGNSGNTRSGAESTPTLNRTDGKGAHLHFTVLDVTRGFKGIDPEPFLPESIRGT